MWAVWKVQTNVKAFVAARLCTPPKSRDTGRRFFNKQAATCIQALNSSKDSSNFSPLIRRQTNCLAWIWRKSTVARSRVTMHHLQKMTVHNSRQRVHCRCPCKRNSLLFVFDPHSDSLMTRLAVSEKNEQSILKPSRQIRCTVILHRRGSSQWFPGAAVRKHKLMASWSKTPLSVGTETVRTQPLSSGNFVESSLLLAQTFHKQVWFSNRKYSQCLTACHRAAR